MKTIIKYLLFIIVFVLLEYIYFEITGFKYKTTVGDTINQEILLTPPDYIMIVINIVIAKITTQVICFKFQDMFDKELMKY
jgi:hypothetical protein